MIYLLLIILSHGLMLLNGGLFNEDWTVYNLSASEKMEYSLQMGNWFNGLIFVLFGQHPLLCRFIAFGCILLSAWLFYKIVHRYLPKEAKVIAVIFAIYPVFFASIQLSLLPRIICQTLFLMAFYLVNNDKRPVLACVLFLISFQTQTLVPLYLIVLFLLWKKDYWVYLALLPLAHVFIKQTFFKPHGFVGGEYGHFKVEQFVGLPHKFISTVVPNILKPITIQVDGLSMAYYLFILFVLTIFIYRLLLERHEDS